MFTCKTNVVAKTGININKKEHGQISYTFCLLAEGYLHTLIRPLSPFKSPYGEYFRILNSQIDTIGSIFPSRQSGLINQGYELNAVIEICALI